MFKQTAIASLLAIAVAGVAHADAGTDKPTFGKQEKSALAGVGSGLVIGAAVGGPPGAIVGAFLGGATMSEIAKRGEAIEAYEQDMSSLQLTVTELKVSESALRERNQRLLAEVADMSRQNGVALTDASLAMDVHFRTSDDTLDADTRQQIEGIAKLAQRFPGLRIALDGYADQRGEAEANLSLSERRVNSVQAALLQAGIPQDRILARSHGDRDASAAVTDTDGLALDRRVSIRLSTDLPDEDVATR